MYQLEEPKYFILFVIIPILTIIFLYVLWWRKKTQKKFTNNSLLQKIAPETSNFKKILKFGLFVLGLSFLIIALVNPKMGMKKSTVKRSGIDIVFALDVSRSMLANDVKTTRLKKAKQIISQTIDKLGGDRVGIIVYAGTAFPLLPITTDHASAKMFLENANTDMLSSQGTAINEALSLTETYFDKDSKTNKFLVIISDGEDHEEETIDIAKKIAQKGIHVFAIGIGTEKGAPIPIYSRGNIVRYKKNYQGETVITKRNKEILQEIADLSDGQYIDGNIIKTAVSKLEKIIVSAEKNEFESKEFSDYKDQFQWFLGFGLLFLLIDVFLFEKKTKWLTRLDLFSEKRK